MQALKLLACHECDALQQTPAAMEGHAVDALCWRCGGHLAQAHRMKMERQLALVLTALILFLLANFFPLFTIEIQGSHQQTSLFGAAYTLWQSDMSLVALLVFVTTLLAPLFEILSLLYVLGIFHSGRQGSAPGIIWLLRLLGMVAPWSMIEVFMLGALVAIVKLSHLAEIHVGVAVWAFAGVMLLMAAVGARFNAQQLWALLPTERGANSLAHESLQA